MCGGNFHKCIPVLLPKVTIKNCAVYKTPFAVWQWGRIRWNGGVSPAKHSYHLRNVDRPGLKKGNRQPDS